MGAPPKTLLWVAFWIFLASILAAASAQFRRPNCRENEFLCDDQQRCISEFEKCDGKKDCVDGTDETSTLCSRFGRSCGALPSSFMCAYGACINKSKECDGNEFDCADNSDEMHCGQKETTEKTSRCSITEFTCLSGDCINLSDVCDGTPNCKDKSDETIARCARMKCPHFSFSCAYGACIDWDLKCDGKPDCADGSEEADNLCNTEVDTTKGEAAINHAADSNSTVEATCPFPSHEHTTYRLGCYVKHPTSPKCQATPGMPVKRNTAVLASCAPGYALPFKYSGERANMICTSPPNFSSMITCEKMCSPLVSEFHDLECSFKGKDVPCDKPMSPGTLVHIQCKEHFKPQSEVMAIPETRCHLDGTWTYRLYKCIPAAHCFAEFIGDAPTDDIKNIQVAVAKFNTKWEVKGEHEQRVGVKTIYHQRGYVGPPDFEMDLAVVELLQNIVLTDYSIPACVDWKKEGTFWSRTQGYIVGFVRNRRRVSSGTLQAASFSHIPPGEGECRIQTATSRFKQGIMWDQFCARQGGPGVQIVQPGESGGGYTFKRSGKYYLYGVLSHRLSGVNSYTVYTLYTNITEHIDWLKENGFHESLV